MKFRLLEALDDITNKAVAKFGITTNIKEAGYILTDGRLLDLSGKNDGGPSNTRTIDHRDVSLIYTDKFDTHTAYLIDFMNRGNIRMDYFSASIDIYKEPTQEQYSTLRQVIQKCIDDRDDLNLDISDEKGDNLANRYYEGKNANVNRVIADIKNYFSVGEFLPMSNLNSFR